MNAHAHDVAQILTDDHREMVELVDRIKNAPIGAERRDLADMLIAEVMRHAVAEEMYVYPAMEDSVPDGSAHVEHDKEEHERIVQVMKRIENTDASDPAFMALIDELEDQLRHHADDEEKEQFPALRAHIGSARMADLGEKVQTAKKLAPTRPHPSAPHSELFHKTVGAGVGMVDRLRDKLSGRRTG
jgi:hemerythrin-like domain-containing protein